MPSFVLANCQTTVCFQAAQTRPWIGCGTSCRQQPATGATTDLFWCQAPPNHLGWAVLRKHQQAAAQSAAGQTHRKTNKTGHFHITIRQDLSVLQVLPKAVPSDLNACLFFTKTHHRRFKKRAHTRPSIVDAVNKKRTSFLPHKIIMPSHGHAP